MSVKVISEQILMFICPLQLYFTTNTNGDIHVGAIQDIYQRLVQITGTMFDCNSFFYLRRKRDTLLCKLGTLAGWLLVLFLHSWHLSQCYAVLAQTLDAIMICRLTL